MCTGSVDPFTHSLIHSFTHTATVTLTVIVTLTLSLTHSLTDSLTHSRTDALTHHFSHSVIDALMTENFHERQGLPDYLQGLKLTDSFMHSLARSLVRWQTKNFL